MLDRPTIPGHEHAAFLLDSLADPCLSFDSEFRYSYINRAAERYIGIPRERLLGKCLWTEFPETLGTIVEREFRRVAEERVTASFQKLHKQRCKWFDITAYPAIDGGIAIHLRDITELKRRVREEPARSRTDATENVDDGSKSTAELERISRLMKLAHQAGCAGAWDWNLLTGELTWTEEYYRLLGLEPDVRPSQDQLLSIVHPDDHAELKRNTDDAVNGRVSVFRDEFRAILPDGTHWIERRAQVVTDASGRPVRLVGMSTDITGRKQIEEGLRETEQRFRMVAETVPEAIFTARPDGFTDYANSRWYEYTGALAESAEGYGWLESIHLDEREHCHREWLISIEQRQPFEYEFRWRRHDGEYRWFGVHAVPLRDDRGAIVRWFGVIADIHGAKVLTQELSRRKEELETAIRSLKESEAHFRTVAATVPEILFTATPEGRTDYVSERFNDYSGRSAAAPLDDEWLQAIHPDDREATMAAWKHALQTGTEYEVTYRLGRKDGVYRWFQCHAVPVQEQDGHISKWFGVCVDIHAHKRLEEELSRRSDELSRSNGDLQRFAYVASHDLQEPLRMIGGFSELLSRKYSAADSQTSEYLGYIRQGVSRMTSLINELLEYSVLAGDDRAPLPVISLESALVKALWGLQEVVRESGAVVTSDPLPSAEADQRLMAQVFQNLVGNAIKYRNSDPPRIHIAARLDGAEWMISVQDNGIGFDMKHADRIFGVFQRLHSKAEIEGSGIGLSIVKRVVERHGGRVWVESEPGQGSTFYFTLPFTQRDPD